MRPLDHIAQVHPYQKRKHRRFGLRYPVHLKVYSDGTLSGVDAVSRNVSVDGLLLEGPSTIPLHSPVILVMTLLGGQIVRPIELAGEGEVVRVELGKSATEVLIALKCTRPLVQIEDRFSSIRN
jgi:hypothetical protein